MFKREKGEKKSEREREKERKSAIRNKDKIPKCNRICRIYTQFTIPRGYLLFFEPLYNYITLSCIVTCSHTCINIGFYMWFLYIHLSMRSRHTGYTRKQRGVACGKIHEEEGKVGRKER